MIEILKKLNFILSPKNKKRSLKYLIINFFNFILEFLSISAILFFLNFFLTENNNIQEFRFSGINANLFFLIIFLIFFFKLIFSVYTVFFQSKFQNFLQSDLQILIFTSYLNLDFQNVVNLKRSDFLNNVINVINIFIFAFFRSLLQLINEIFLLIGIILFLVVYGEFKIIIILGIFLLFIFINFKFFKNKIELYGKRSIEENSKIIQIINYFSISIHEVFIYNLTNKFKNIFKFSSKNIAYYKYFNDRIVNSIKHFIEFFGIILILSIVYFLKSYGEMKISEIIITISVYVIAIARIMPIINRTAIAEKQIRYGLQSVKEVYQIIKKSYSLNKPIAKIRKHKFRKEDLVFHKIKFENVSFGFNKKKVFENINFEINKGEIYGIKGKSGSGKSSLLNIILGLFDNYDGKISLDTVNIKNIHDYNILMGFVPQEVNLINDTIKNNILFFRDIKIDKAYFEKLIKVLDLNELIYPNQDGEDFIISETNKNISGGQKQRIGIARALISKPKILVLDEFTSALDEETEARILKYLKKLKDELNVTIILTSHKKTTLNICNRIYDLDERHKKI